MKKNVGGFTIVELLMTLVIIGIMASLASASFQGVFERNTVKTEADAALHMIKLARSDAIKRSNTVTVSSAGGWDQDWQVISDINGDGNLDGGDELLYEKKAPQRAIGISREAGGTVFGFASTGFRTGGATKISFCDPTGVAVGYSVTVSRVGQITKAEVAAASCP